MGASDGIRPAACALADTRGDPECCDIAAQAEEDRAVDRDRCGAHKHPQRKIWPPAPQARCAEDARCDDERDDSRGFLERDVRLLGPVREDIDREIGHGTEVQERLERPEAENGKSRTTR
jgi:hypothetical protein